MIYLKFQQSTYLFSDKSDNGISLYFFSAETSAIIKSKTNDLYSVLPAIW